MFTLFDDFQWNVILQHYICSLYNFSYKIIEVTYPKHTNIARDKTSYIWEKIAIEIHNIKQLDLFKKLQKRQQQQIDS